MKRAGRKSAAQTKAPKKDRIYLSKVNRQGSAESSQSGEGIVFSKGILDTLKNKADDFNESHPSNKVSLSTLKAVFRRGAGAYSKSHRPTISGGKPNSRTAWAYARVNKFLLKKGGTKVKAAYVQDDDLMMDGGNIKLLAPNGQPSNLTPEQYKLVRTPQFKAWFGDWENDPANASKVVDVNGEPLVVYHGTILQDEFFGQFNIVNSNEELAAHFGTYEQAQNRINQILFAQKYIDDSKTKKEGNPIIKPFFLNLKRPIELRDKTKWDAYTLFRTIYRERKYKLEPRNEDIYWQMNYLLENGYDGIKYDNLYEGDGFSYAIFLQNSVKLADGTNTTFEANNPDIRYENGGTTEENDNVVKVITYYIFKVTQDQDELVLATEDYQEALKEYSSINLSDFELNLRDKNGLGKRLDAITKTYQFVGELDIEEGEEISEYMDESYYDDADYWKLIDESIEEIENKSITRVNERTDELIDLVRMHYNALGGYVLIPIGNETLNLRIKDHSGLSKNRGRSKYFLSVVISDQNPTSRFKQSGVSFNPSEEIEFTSDDSYEKIIDTINYYIENYKKAENVSFEDGGETNYNNNDLFETTYTKVLNGEMNSDDAAIFLFDNGIEVDEDQYDKLSHAEKIFKKKGRGLEVGDIITIKGKNGLSDFKGNFRGYTPEGKLVIVYEGGKQMSINSDEYYINENDIRFEDGGSIDETAQMYIDIISMSPNEPKYQKYKQVLFNDYGIDYDKQFGDADEKLIGSANLDNIKTKKDFLNYDNYGKYAKQIFNLRGFANNQPKHIEGIVTLKQAENIGKQLGFKVVEKDYKGVGNYAEQIGYEIRMPNTIDINVFIHEIGHFFDHKLMGEYDGFAKTSTYASSPYLINKSDEVFAENFMHYFIAPQWMKDNMPKVYEELDKNIPIEVKDVINKLIDSMSKLKYAEGGIVSFNKMMQKEWLPTYKSEYKNDISKINEMVARHYMYGIAEKHFGSVNEIDFANESKNPRNHFQMRMYIGDKILWTSPFINVDDNHKVVASKTKVELLDNDYKTIKENIKLEHGGELFSSAPKDESDYIPSETYRESIRNYYYDPNGFRKYSSREVPYKGYLPKVGSWRIDNIILMDGRMIDKLVVIDIDDIIPTELSADGKLDVTKRGDEQTYANWIKQGLRSIPIEVLQTPNGKYKLLDGHRRYLAHKLAGKDKIEAWVSPNAISPRGTNVGLTFELANSLSYKEGGLTFEEKYGKNNYVNLTAEDLDEYAEDMYNLIANAYSHIGGHLEFQNPEMVRNTDLNFWVASDIDADPEMDVLLGGKKTNFGTKITTLAQDGERASKLNVSKKAFELLSKNGFYAEVDEALAEKLKVPIVTDENIIRKVIGKPDIEMNEDGTYYRNIQGKRKKKVLVGMFEHLKDGGKLYRKGGAINQYLDDVGILGNTDVNDPQEASFKEGGKVQSDYQKWKRLVNMSASELEAFYNSKEGKVAGLTPSQAKSQGIDSGRESARWILKMKKTPYSDWTPQMHRWANKQISFISRMSGMKGDLIDDKGNKTRKYLSLLIWGHNPKKSMKLGGDFTDKKSISGIARKHKSKLEYLYKQLREGIKVEMEHTNDKKIAEKIALDHLDEMPDYYVRLKKMESHKGK